MSEPLDYLASEYVVLKKVPRERGFPQTETVFCSEPLD
jgi:hypothetical protein